MPRPLLALTASMLLLAFACGGDDEPPPPPPPAAETYSLSSALQGMQDGPPEPKAPEVGEPPQEPIGLRENKPAAEAPKERSTDSKACRRNRAEREALEKRVLQQRSSGVDRAEGALSQANEAMRACFADTECAIDGKRIKTTQERIAAAERSYEAAIEQIGVLEAGFFEIDKKIKRTCGG